MFIGPCIILLVEQIEPTWCHCMKDFIAQHVSNVITFILRSRRLYVGVLFCFGVYWCGSAGVGWYPNAGWSTRRLLRMNVITFETCWAIKNFHSDIKLVQFIQLGVWYYGRNKLKDFENLRRHFIHSTQEVTGHWKYYIRRSSMFHTPQRIQSRWFRSGIREV